MSGSQIIQNIVPAAVDVGNDPSISQVYSFPLTLTQGATITIDLKTLVNLHRVGGVQGLMADNSQGTAALTVTTVVGQVLVVPLGSQAMLPLFLSADKTITFNGAGTVNVVLTNFFIGPSVWNATAAGSVVTISGTVSASDSATHSLLSAIEGELSGTISVSDSATHTALTAIQAELGGTLSVGVSGTALVSDSATHTALTAIEAELAGTLTVGVSGTALVSDSATHTVLSAISANTANLENAVVSGGGSAVPSYGVNVGGIYQPAPTSGTSGSFRPLETDPFGALQVDDLGVIPTYSAAFAFPAVASANDILSIYGSSSKTVQLLRIEFSGLFSSSAAEYVSIYKRSSSTSGGSPSTLTAVSHDSTDPTATATVNAYASNPTPGTLVGVLSTLVYEGGIVPPASPLIFDFALGGQKSVVLRGASQGVTLSLDSGNGSGTTIYGRIIWREF
jgi:hypothetical protein